MMEKLGKELSLPERLQPQPAPGVEAEQKTKAEKTDKAQDTSGTEPEQSADDMIGDIMGQ